MTPWRGTLYLVFLELEESMRGRFESAKARRVVTDGVADLVVSGGERLRTM